MPVIPVISIFVVAKGAQMYEFTIKMSVPRVEILPFVARIVPPCTCSSELSPVSERVFALNDPLKLADVAVNGPVKVVLPADKAPVKVALTADNAPVKVALTADNAPVKVALVADKAPVKKPAVPFKLFDNISLPA